jgi:hypothetical protein
MMPHRKLLFLVTMLLVPSCATAQAGDLPMKVLFIGNSYTSVNDLPSLLSALADAAGGQKIETEQHVVGGWTFEQHVKDKKAIEKIREKKWDVVVLQEHSLQPVLNRESMHRYARILHEEISKQRAKTVFYLTWARRNIPEMQDGADPTTSPTLARAMYRMTNSTGDFETWCEQRKAGLTGGLNGAYFDIANELSATVAPVGIAWKGAFLSAPNVVLHQADKSHPNPRGSYLAACVFYATLFDKSPMGLPGELKTGTTVLVRVAPNEAKMFQEIAWQTVQALKPPR